jgi:D-alanine transaminase
MTIAYLNGSYLPLEQACVPAMDRGFLFSDGVYEIIPVYCGKPFRLEEHLVRLANSLKIIKLESAIDLPFWRELSQELVQRNGGGYQYIYLQITRGPAPKRDYRFPETVTPTVFAYTQPYTPPTLDSLQQGMSVVTLPDIRWDLCSVKSISLLGSVLQRQKATEEGADEGILIRDGQVIEGTSCNVFIVKQGTIFTPPKSDYMLGGITRAVVLEIAEQQKIPYREEKIPEADLYSADEIWITSSLREIQPVLLLNKKLVGNGKPGPVWQKMIHHYREFIA